MFDPFSAWNRLLVVSASVTSTNMRAMETLTAANAVITARTKIITDATRSPLTGDHGELGRMVPEKVEAFSRAGSATVTAWGEAQSAWARHMQHLGGMAMRGRLPTPTELAELGGLAATLALESIEAAAQLGSATLAPVHRKATANARRLKRKTGRRPRNGSGSARARTGRPERPVLARADTSRRGGHQRQASAAPGSR